MLAERRRKRLGVPKDGGPNYTHADSMLERDRLSRMQTAARLEEEERDACPGQPKITKMASSMSPSRHAAAKLAAARRRWETAQRYSPAGTPAFEGRSPGRSPIRDHAPPMGMQPTAAELAAMAVDALRRVSAAYPSPAAAGFPPPAGVPVDAPFPTPSPIRPQMMLPTQVQQGTILMPAASPIPIKSPSYLASPDQMRGVSLTPPRVVARSPTPPPRMPGGGGTVRFADPTNAAPIMMVAGSPPRRM